MLLGIDAPSMLSGWRRDQLATHLIGDAPKRQRDVRVEIDPRLVAEHPPRCSDVCERMLDVAEPQWRELWTDAAIGDAGDR